MLHLLKKVIIVLLIIVILLVPATIFLAKFDNRTPVGAIIKRILVRDPVLVNLINLNEPGDGRYIYLKSNQPIQVNVYYQTGFAPNPQLSTWVTQMISQSISQKVNTTVNPEPLTGIKDDYSNLDLNLIRSNLLHPEKSGPILNLVYLSSYHDYPSYVGLTLHRDTIFLFKQAMNETSNTPAETSAMEQSTIMHEWGHIIGLDHTELTDCIMSAQVEAFERGSGYKNNFLTQYCSDELYQFQQLKNSM
jgi:hypothetical protein